LTSTTVTRSLGKLHSVITRISLADNKTLPLFKESSKSNSAAHAEVENFSERSSVNEVVLWSGVN